MLLWYAMLWALPKSKSFSPVGQTHSLGIFEYIKFHQYSAHTPLPLTQPLKSMEISWLAITLNIILSVAPTILTIRVGGYLMLPRYSNRFCDECGYDLKPSSSPACPECGHQNTS